MKFAIRDLLWLTALAALAVAWWLNHRGQSKRIQDLEETITTISPALPPSVLDSLKYPP